MGIYCDHEILDNYVVRACEALIRAGFIPLPESFKEISYGVSFKVDTGGKKQESAAIYYSDKKGFSVVTKHDGLRMVIASLRVEDDAAGNDEAGKGDIFGPLVVCSFYLSDAQKDILKLNIKDSKHVEDDDVLAMSDEITKKFSSAFAVIKIMPPRYNALYADLRTRNRSLNHLLAWAHGKSVTQLLEKQPDCKRFIVDQFSNASEIMAHIRSCAGTAQVDFQTKAERHLCVAAASIMARAEYLRSLKKLSEEVLEKKIYLKSGSGDLANETIRFIRKNFDEAIFQQIAKLHFSNLSAPDNG